MRVSELIRHLQDIKKKHGDVPVIYDLHSDYAAMMLEEVTVVDAITVKGSAGAWLRRAYYHDGSEPTDKVVHFPGN